MTVAPLSFAQINAGLRAPGFSLGTNQFTFSIPGAGSVWPGYGVGTEPDIGYTAFTKAQADLFRQALQTWDEYIAPKFIEVADNATSRGEVRIAFTAITQSGVAAYAYQGSPRAPGTSVGDFWVDADQSGGNLAFGTYGYETLLHEIVSQAFLQRAWLHLPTRWY